MTAREPGSSSILRRVIRYFVMSDRGQDHSAGAHIPYLLLCAAFLLLPFLFQYGPAGREEQTLTLAGITLPGMCPSRDWFGVACPGCGLTRSFTALTHGEFRASFRFHRLGIFVYLFFLYQAGFRIFCLCRLRSPIPPALLRMQTRIPAILILLLAANWLLQQSKLY